jgi:hypothetical protein
MTTVLPENYAQLHCRPRQFLVGVVFGVVLLAALLAMRSRV